ncbi:MAG: M23 family metallopeptidase [Leptospiraceae bacterium]|nr:M23 family metallopeptidase [Leptospiraceae bacterium]
MRKNIFLSALICLAFWLKVTAVESSTKKAVRVDNDFFQTYKGKQGRWSRTPFLKGGYKAYLETVESSEEEFRDVNGLKQKDNLSPYRQYFFPYGENYAKQLLNEGKGRDIIISDHRDFIWPVGKSGPFVKISSKLGQRKNSLHTGIDITCPTGTPILAAADGIVTTSGSNGNYGNLVIIQHELNQLQTFYAHNSYVLVKEGDKISKGQIIAYSGSTGHSTGPHLHFEVRYQNIILNPEHYLLPPASEADGKFTVMKEGEE